MDEDEDNIVAALRRGEDGWEYAAADEIETLRAENAKLRELLKPFMKEKFPDYFDDGRVIPISASCGAIRAARTAMGDSDG